MEEPNIEQLRMLSFSLFHSVEAMRPRYIVAELLSALNAGPRIKLLRGFRGVGKTTAMLQAFGQHQQEALYFSADSPAIKGYGIYKTGVVAVKSGFTLLFIDEVHTYPEWKGEIKALHDEFQALKVIASGSAPLALVPERREELICLHECSFTEFIYLKKTKTITSTTEWKNKESAMKLVATEQTMEADFHAYMKVGGFPLSIYLGEEHALNAIYHSIRKSIREDAVFFLKMSKEKIFAMENLLNMLATSKPGELNITSLASSLHVSKTVIYEIIDALVNMEIVRVMRPYAHSASLVRAEPKLLFFHPNMRFAMCRQLGIAPEPGAVREELAVFGFSERGWKAFTVKGEKKSPDYIIVKGGERHVVEIGGPGKGAKQLKGFEDGLILGEFQLIPLLLVAKSSKNEQK